MINNPELKTMKNLTSIDEKLAEHTFNSLRECISITDMDDNLIYVNDAFLKTYGFRRDEIFGLNIKKLRSPHNDPQKVKESRPTTLKGGWEGEIYNRKKDGTDFMISLRTSMVKDDNGEPIALVGTAIDLTERKKYEDELRKSEKKFYKLFQEIKESVYESTPEGRLVDINPSGVELFNYDSKEELMKVDIVKDLYVNPKEREQFK